MTCKEADTLLYFLETLPGVTSARVYEQTGDAVVCYSGEREDILRALRSFQYRNVHVPDNVLENSGRELNRIYESPRFEFGYVYGQRRIGKTTLMEMLSHGKKTLFLFAPDSDDLDIRIYFSEELNRAMGRPGGLYPDWDSFFQAAGEFFGDEKGLLIIDEYPNIILSRDGKRKKTSFPSFLQKAIDGTFRHQRFTLVLTGSNVSFIEREIKDSHGPLYQRNTFSMQVKKLNFEDAVLALKDVRDDWEKAKFLALTNTFPYYLSLVDTGRSFEENLRRLFYDRLLGPSDFHGPRQRRRHQRFLSGKHEQGREVPPPAGRGQRPHTPERVPVPAQRDL